MLPADVSNIAKTYQDLLQELTTYDPNLVRKKHVLALTKADLLTPKEIRQHCQQLSPIPIIPISSVTKRGLTQLKHTLWQALQSPCSSHHN